MKRQIQFGIKAQLTLCACAVALLCLGVLSAATYVSSHGVIIDLRQDRLKVIAQLKSAQVTQAIGTLMGEVVVFSGRNFIQDMLLNAYFHNGTSSDDADYFESGIDSADDMIMGVLYTYDGKIAASISSNATLEVEFANVSIPEILFPVERLPITDIFEYTSSSTVYMEGPEQANDHYYLSMTRKLTENNPQFEFDGSNTSLIPEGDAIGYLTMIMTARSIQAIINQSSIIDNQDGQMALIELADNVTTAQARNLTEDGLENLNGTLVLPAQGCENCMGREFALEPFAVDMFVNGSAGCDMDCPAFLDYEGAAVGYAPVNVLDHEWGVFIIQFHHVINLPLYRLRNMLLISAFCIAFGVFVGALLLSGWMVRPITRLQSATEQATAFMMPPKKAPRIWYKPWKCQEKSSATKHQTSFWKRAGQKSKKALITLKLVSPPANATSETDRTSASSSGFQLPQKVATRRWIKDELTDLTETFNEMTDELRKQYATLEERVTQRTKEIENARVVAESANEAKSLFIANITHELRTPLNGILGMTAVSMDEEDPKQIKEALKVIFKSGELLLHLLTDLLSFSKNSMGNMKLETREFMVPEVMMQLNAIFVEQSRRNKLDLSIEMATEELQHRVFRGDINRILQIVINFVSNSLKFTPKGGKIRVTVSAVHGNTVDQNKIEKLEPVPDEGNKHESQAGTNTTNDPKPNVEHLDPDDPIAPPSTTEKGNLPTVDDDNDKNNIMTISFEVEDNGPGIAPSLQSRIFEPFVQGDLQFSERRVGAGLGLSICRQLAGLMNGTVSLQSELGKGSTFTFKVPLSVVHDTSDYQFADISKVDAVPDMEMYNYDLERRIEEIGIVRNNSVGGATSSSGGGSISGGERGDSRDDGVTSSSEGGSSSNSKRPQMVRNPSSLGEDRKINFPIKVLVAEDNKVNQEVMLRMLKLEGIENVSIANDGLEAVSLVREASHNDEKFDIIFMDVQMPNLDGRQATTIIREDLRYEGVIVAVSAFADNSNVNDCLACGMNSFLAKPLRRPHLRKMLQDVFLKDKEDRSEEKSDNNKERKKS
uniref:histidine kinase n=1 Tax=Blastobotrys adeninivorans TaxID=409370 RepID=A0A060TCE8_BLAAD